MSPPAQALATHLINQTLSSLSVLETLNIISRDGASQIRSKLPNPYGPFPSLETASSPSINTSFSQLAVGPSSPPPQQQSSSQVQMPPMHNQMAVVPSLPARTGPQETRARALWDYAGTEPDDLQFRSGDIIIIDEEVNDQWYRGRVIPNGQYVPLKKGGLFPSNYIEKEINEKQSYAPPSQQPMVPYQSHYQGPPQHPMTIHSPGPQGQVAVAEHEKKSKFSKIGSKLGDSAVHGAGFGFGASIASNVVNKIF